MAGNKYISNSSGTLTEVASIQSSAGVGDAGKIPALDAAGKLDNSMMPTGVGTDTDSLEATETLAGGDIVNVYTSGGVAKMRKADATSAGKEASGFVLASVTSGQNGTIYYEQRITGLSGLTAGAFYYLATTAGGVTSTAPSGSGNVVQRIGRATDTTVLIFQPTAPITLA